jgi:LmbE family N-acetylglucosaminyl deacetylase
MEKITSLIIAPHADDEILGCGGILDKNCFVYYCGINETKWNQKNKIIDAGHRISTNKRFKEIERTANFLGFRYEINLNSNVNTYTESEFIPIFEELINRIKPEKIFLPSSVGYNQDHRTIFNACFIALRPHDRNFFVNKVLVYEAPHDVFWSHENKVNYFVPIDIERKVKAYLFQESQVRPFRSPDMVRRIAKLRGYMSNCEYSEAFQILRWVDSNHNQK